MNQKCYPSTTKARKWSDSNQIADMKIHLTYRKLNTGLENNPFQIVLYISFDDESALSEFYNDFPNGLTYYCTINGEEVSFRQAIHGGFDYELKGIAFEDIDATTVDVKYCIK